MKVSLESTTKIVTLIVDGHEVKARIWEGTTERGITCHAFITRIAVSEFDDVSEFEQELEEKRKPSATIEAIPLRLII